MSNSFSFDEAYRNGSEYKGWCAALHEDYPNTPQWVIDRAIITHKMFPDSCKKVSNREMRELDKLKPTHSTERMEIKGIYVREAEDALPPMPPPAGLNPFAVVEEADAFDSEKENVPPV